jgi:hypothetical protein
MPTNVFGVDRKFRVVLSDVISILHSLFISLLNWFRIIINFSQTSALSSVRRHAAPEGNPLEFTGLTDPRLHEAL